VCSLISQCVAPLSQKDYVATWQQRPPGIVRRPSACAPSFGGSFPKNERLMLWLRESRGIEAAIFAVLHFCCFHGLSEQHHFVSGRPAIVLHMKQQFFVGSGAKVCANIRELNGLSRTAFGSVTNFVCSRYGARRF